jgi:hypothetical protein
MTTRKPAAVFGKTVKEPLQLFHFSAGGSFLTSDQNSFGRQAPKEKRERRTCQTERMEMSLERTAWKGLVCQWI